MSKGRYEKRKVGETGKGRNLSEAKSGERVMEEKKPMIRCVDVKKIYNKGKENQLEALAGVSCEIWQGELVAVMGKSGCGKSTLLHILGCLDTLDGGEYQLNGKKMEAARDREMARIRNEQIGIVLQDFALVEEFTAMENVLLPLDFSAKKIHGKKALALEALKKVEMEAYAGQVTGTMSGGQKQRVAIARAIVNSPAVLLADEPTGALDTATSEGIMDLFEKLNRSGMTIVVVTHDPQVALRCGRTFEMKDGRIREAAAVRTDTAPG